MISEQFTTIKDLSSHNHCSVRASEEHSPITSPLVVSLLFSLSHTPDFWERGGAGGSVYLWAEDDDSCAFFKWQLKTVV